MHEEREEERRITELEKILSWVFEHVSLIFASMRQPTFFLFLALALFFYFYSLEKHKKKNDERRRLR